MSLAKLNYPPLSPEDILSMRGQPLSKRNEFSRKTVEEWIYYNAKEKIKEIYLFKNRKLIKYKIKEAI